MLTPAQFIKQLVIMTQQHLHFTRRDICCQAACFVMTVGSVYFTEGALAAVGVGAIIIGLGIIMLFAFLAGTIQPKHSAPAGKSTADNEGDDDPYPPETRSRRSLLAERGVSA
jgi:hypothetical protein